jgi:hypothetical protein
MNQNYYYVTLRNSNKLSLRKLVNGTLVIQAVVPFALLDHSVHAAVHAAPYRRPTGCLHHGTAAGPL